LAGVKGVESPFAGSATAPILAGVVSVGGASGFRPARAPIANGAGGLSAEPIARRITLIIGEAGVDEVRADDCGVTAEAGAIEREICGTLGEAAGLSRIAESGEDGSAKSPAPCPTPPLDASRLSSSEYRVLQ
jgi:hypothetical protein